MYIIILSIFAFTLTLSIRIFNIFACLWCDLFCTTANILSVLQNLCPLIHTEIHNITLECMKLWAEDMPSFFFLSRLVYSIWRTKIKTRFSVDPIQTRCWKNKSCQFLHHLTRQKMFKDGSDSFLPLSNLFGLWVGTRSYRRELKCKLLPERNREHCPHCKVNAIGWTICKIWWQSDWQNVYS